ncbi:sugar phosphate isomerase/epimerase family protein [Roseibium aggregatum]|uniref:sugar phosphate isomerase/epimerase family protein n=1 Tax=Roseibium aggregatum TaxID=187304 RepID=UPI0025ACC54A|nr:sugar phosphate isomerase/epimerase family protein [Roseibium aggregatum]WJS05558.1 sugar phosphate isomerase/epimerase family protein [Roseibium aggregatum]
MSLAITGIELADGEGISPLISMAKETGAIALELWQPKNVTPSTAAEVAAAVHGAGLTVGCLSTGVELYRDEGAELQQAKLLETIDLAYEIGATRVSSFFGFSKAADDDRTTAGYLSLIAPCLEKSATLGITLLLENEFDAFGWDPSGSDVTRRPDALFRLFERARDDHLSMTFDAANFVCAGIDPLDAYRALREHVGYVHLKDVVALDAETPLPGYRMFQDHRRSYSTCPLGQGVVPWPELLAALKSSGYAGDFCLEPHATQENRDAAWRAAAAQVQSWLTDLDWQDAIG